MGIINSYRFYWIFNILNMNVSINMRISEYLIKNFIDSCSVHKHNAEHKKNIIKLYKEEIKKVETFISNEEKSLKRLDN